MQINIDIEQTIADAVAAAIAPERIGEIIKTNVQKTVDEAVNQAFRYHGEFSKAMMKAVEETTPHEMTLDKQADWNHFITAAINQRLTAYNEQRLTEVIMPTLDKLLEKPPESIKLSEIVLAAVAHWREYADAIDPKLEVSRSNVGTSTVYSHITISKKNRSYLSKDIQIACNDKGEVYSVKFDDSDVSKIKFAGPFFSIEQKLFNLYACRTKIEIDVESIEDVDLDSLEESDED
jgi:hypothetical protein